MPGLEHSRSESVRNGSESPVPNGPKFTVGRPAVATDAQLAEIAARLNHQLGRPPRADELITEAGGCQRKRALAAIRSLKLDLATRTVQTTLVFPPAIESGIRVLMTRWLLQAAEQLAAKHLEEQERSDVRAQAQQALIEEQQTAIDTLKQQIADRERVVAEFRRRIHDLETDLSAARAEGLRQSSIAEERFRLLRQFEPRTADPSSTALAISSRPASEGAT